MMELSKVQQTLSELIRLNKMLLFLSKIENNQYIERSDVNVNTTLHHQLEVLSEVYASKAIDVHIYEKGQCTFLANAELMTALVSNLLRNAYLHNTPQGSIDVYVTDKALSIANTGDEPSLDTKRLFDRFYKAKHGKKHSNGLGLSIVKAICEASHLAIHYSYEGDKHIFTVCADKKD
jgi:signal transduction histidine kinase